MASRFKQAVTQPISADRAPAFDCELGRFENREVQTPLAIKLLHGHRPVGEFG